jgi:hypothetical protein
MTSKRKAEATGPGHADETPTTADIAESIRKQLIIASRKRRRIRTCPTIDVEKIVPMPSKAPFFLHLPRELRDRVYQFLWKVPRASVSGTRRGTT